MNTYIGHGWRSSTHVFMISLYVNLEYLALICCPPLELRGCALRRRRRKLEGDSGGGLYLDVPGLIGPNYWPSGRSIHCFLLPSGSDS
eukprot:4972524-Pleurochrysis_carterae.AAC.1